MAARRPGPAHPVPAAGARGNRDADPHGLELRCRRPERILVLNCGSSSLKYTFFDTEDDARQVRGQVERSHG